MPRASASRDALKLRKPTLPTPSRMALSLDLELDELATVEPTAVEIAEEATRAATAELSRRVWLKADCRGAESQPQPTIPDAPPAAETTPDVATPVARMPLLTARPTTVPALDLSPVVEGILNGLGYLNGPSTHRPTTSPMLHAARRQGSASDEQPATSSVDGGSVDVSLRSRLALMRAATHGERLAKAHVSPKPTAAG